MTRKTLFPLKPIEPKYETGYVSKYNFKKMNKSSEDNNDFVFSNKDTIAVVLLFKYKKNDEIRFSEFLNQSMDLSDIGNVSNNDNDNHMSMSHKINLEGSDNSKNTGRTSKNNEVVPLVHLFTVSGLRMLYTLNIEYLFYHRFFEIFNIEEYKKLNQLNAITSCGDMDNSDYDPFSKYKKKHKKEKKREKNSLLEELIDEMEKNCINDKHYSFEDMPNVKRELFMVLNVERPQFNFQNEESNSQLLLVGKGTMNVSLYNFIIKDPKNLRKKYSLKKQIMCTFSEMCAYVAPTNIDIVNPTFWLSSYADENVEEEDIPQMENLLYKFMETDQ